MIRCQIAAFKLPSGIALYLAGWKEHYSLYPAGERLIRALKDELAPHKFAKGTIRFALSAPVPSSSSNAFAEFRAK